MNWPGSKSNATLSARFNVNWMVYLVIIFELSSSNSNFCIAISMHHFFINAKYYGIVLDLLPELFLIIFLSSA
jgi:hypothetical protein